MFSLILLTALAQPAQEPATPGGTAPVQVLARIDAKGKLTITHVSTNDEPPSEEMVLPPKKGDEKVPVKTKVKATSLTVTTVELPAKVVEAYTVDGKTLSAEKLATLLAKEQTVLVAADGKKPEPFHLQLYKDNTILLVPPVGTMYMGIPTQGGPWPGTSPIPPPRKLPDEPKREKDREPVDKR